MAVDPWMLRVSFILLSLVIHKFRVLKQEKCQKVALFIDEKQLYY